MSDPTRAEITRLLTKNMLELLRPRGIVLPEVDTNWGRLDLLCFKGLFPWHYQENDDFEFWGIEIKSCREDFLSDEKWWNYLLFGELDRLTFVCPYEAITLTDLDSSLFVKKRTSIPPEVMDRIGLYVFNPNYITAYFNNASEIPHDFFGYRSHKVLRRTRHLQYNGYGCWKDQRHEKRKRLKQTILVRALDYFLKMQECPHCRKEFNPFSGMIDV